MAKAVVERRRVLIELDRLAHAPRRDPLGRTDRREARGLFERDVALVRRQRRRLAATSPRRAPCTRTSSFRRRSARRCAPSTWRRSSDASASRARRCRARSLPSALFSSPMQVKRLMPRYASAGCSRRTVRSEISSTSDVVIVLDRVGDAQRRRRARRDRRSARRTIRSCCCRRSRR